MTPDENDRLDELVRAAAREYNSPGAVPRERMWARVQAARETARGSERHAPVARRLTTLRAWQWAGGSAAAAAVLLLGIAIGRSYERRSTAPAPSVASTPARPASAANVLPPDTSAQTKAPSRAQIAAAPAPRGAHDGAARHGPGSSGTPDSMAAPDPAYQLAVARHLVGTEAMLTSFRAAARSGQVDAQLTAWARDLLTTTRLFESSPAARDPAMRRLLGDLELVLVQIAQYSNSEPDHAQELELIEHSMERRAVISKLRTTIPAGRQSAGT